MVEFRPLWANSLQVLDVVLFKRFDGASTSLPDSEKENTPGESRGYKKAVRLFDRNNEIIDRLSAINQADFNFPAETGV